MEGKIKLHVLKIQEPYFYDVIGNLKKAELRKNDRNFQEGDLIHFTDVDGYEFADCVRNISSTLLFRITHVLDASKVIPNLKEHEYVVLSIERYQ